ncbi:MAG TPA: hypothetical protein VK209_11165 [Candidatus Sulfotelmatobacter sp.]|nr:hypothetical protein [Candidatus Sulfotelmatobacter sp.]
MQVLATNLIIALQSATQFWNNFLNTVAVVLPGVIGAIIVIIVGVIVGWLFGKVVNRIINRTVEKSFDKSSLGQTFQKSGFDLSNFIGGVLEAFIIVIAISIAFGMLNIPGEIGALLAQVALYLPRLLGGILVIVLGIVFVDFLSTLIGNVIRPAFPQNKTEIADMIKNLLFLGLVAVVLNIALDLLLLTAGGLVYSLILGFVIIGAGVILTDTLIASITEDHTEFTGIAGYAKFILYSIFLLIGAGAIFSSFGGVTTIVANIAWGFAIALAIVLVPIVYSLARRMQTEAG